MYAKVTVLVSSLILSLNGSELAWRSGLFEHGETSLGEPLSNSWTFSLGYFAVNFVPSSENTVQWSQNWTTLDVAAYNDFQSRFVGVWLDDGSVPDGMKGYIWGFNRGSSNPEWILMGADDWTWPLPASNPIDPGGGDPTWEVDLATQVVVGQVNLGDIHMKTAAVTGSPPLLEGQDWLNLYFTAAELRDPSLTGWEMDPDQDGWTNLSEYAFGLNPLQNDWPVVEGRLSGGFFEFTIQKAENVAVTFVGEVSRDLVTWKRDEASVALVSGTFNTLTFRDLGPVSQAAPHFGRVEVSLQP